MAVRHGEAGRFTPTAHRLGVLAVLIGGVSLALATFASREAAFAGLGAPMPVPSLGILLAGFGIVGLARPPTERLARRVSIAAVAVASAIGLAALLAGPGSPWMSAPGAAALALAGFAALLARSPREDLARAGEILAYGVLGIGVLALLGHFYHVDRLFGRGPVPVSVWTASGVGCLGAAIVTARREFSLARVLSGRSLGAAYLRRALPALVGIPLACGVAATLGVEAGVLDLSTAFALFTVVPIAALCFVGVVHARRIDALGREWNRLESLFQRTFENAAVGMAHLDAQGRWLRVNDRLCELLGWSREELVRGSRRPNGAADDLTAGVPIEPALLRGELESQHSLQRCVTKQGNEVFAEVVVSTDRDAQGDAAYLIAVVQDVTQRRQTEAELELAQRALACSSDGVIIATATPPEGEIVAVNPAFTRITGLAPEEVIGQSWRALGEQGDAVPSLCDLCRLLERDDSVSVLLRGRRQGRDEYWSEIRIAPVYDSHTAAVTHHVGIQEDVTERLAAAAERERLLAQALAAREDAERAGRAKDEFFALISHELRSPLAAITSWLDVLQRSDDVPEVRARAHDVLKRNAALLARLIGDLLDAARIASGKLEIEREPFDLLAVLKNAVGELEPVAHERGVTLVLDAAVESAFVEGDPGRLDQVVRNLIGNAFKFTPAGGRVEVALERAGEALELEVADTGAGIAPEVLPYVFERFRQAEGSALGPAGGLGLGLSIVRHLVELHGGKVAAASDGLGRGAAFRVELPAIPVPRRIAASRVPLRFDALEELCVLVLDPDRNTAEVLAMALEHADAEVMWVRNAVEALAQLDALQPHVLVAAFDAAPGEAAELARGLRHAPYEQSRRVACIALSTDDTAGSRRAAREAGFDAYLTRPFEPARLVALARSLVTRATRVLVVDDDSDSADALALLLSRRGFEVECAYDGGTALAEAERFEPDVVVTDLRLGGIDGAELAGALRAKRGDVRVVAVSGRVRNELGELAGRFDGFVRKPVDIEELLVAMASG